MDLSFYKEKKVLITGHTGFKGSWMSVVLANAGAEVIGYSTCGRRETRLFDLCGIKEQITHIQGDVRDLDHLLEVFGTYRPEIVIHMAAQPIVRDSYRDPVGIRHECLRDGEYLRSGEADGKRQVLPQCHHGQSL